MCSPWIFGDSESEFFFAKLFHGHLLWLYPWILEGQTDPFKIQMSPRAYKTIFYWFLCAIIHGFLVIRDSGFFVGRNFLWMFIKTLAMEQVGTEGKPTHFQVQKIPRARIPPVFPMIVFYNTSSLLVILIFNFKKCRNFSWTSVMNFMMQSFWPHSHAGHF